MDDTRGTAKPLPAGVASVVVFTLCMLAFLHVESQWALAGLLAGAIVVLAVMARLGFLRQVEASFETNQHVMNTLVVLAVLSVAAIFHDMHFALLMLATVLLYVVVCLGLNVQFGYAGVANFAGAAFFGVGAYTAAMLATKTGLPHVLGIFGGGAMAALMGCTILLPVLRTRGHYAAMITIAFAILFKTFLEVNDMFGGPQGFKVPGFRIMGWSFNDNIEFGDVSVSFYMNYFLLSLLLASIVFVFTRRLERSWVGLSLDAVRLDEISASAFGINVVRWKITAFILGNFLIGLAGAIYAHMTGFVAPNSFAFGDSLMLVSILILGGIGNPWGILPAAVIVLMLPEKLQFIQEYRFLIYAVLVIFILLYRPEGLLPRRLRNYIPGRAKT